MLHRVIGLSASALLAVNLVLVASQPAPPSVLVDGPNGPDAFSAAPSTLAPEPSPSPAAGSKASPTPAVESVPTEEHTTEPASEDLPDQSDHGTIIDEYQFEPGPRGDFDGRERPADSITFPHEPGQMSWSERTDAHAFELKITTGPVVAGQPATFQITAWSRTEADCCVIILEYGSGGSDQHNELNCVEANSPTESASFVHTYNRAGEWDFRLQIHDECLQDGDPMLVAYGTVDVADGPSSGQGPKPVDVFADLTCPTNNCAADLGQTIYLYAQAVDGDGWISRMSVDWGDGAIEDVPLERSPSECTEGADGWPQRSEAWTPSSPPPSHTYAGPGIYTVRVTAWSTSCDGAETQQGTGSFEWGWGDPDG